MRKLPGVRLLKNKVYSAPITLPLPPKVVLPMTMHIGAPCIPCVEIGQRVCVGEVVGKPTDGSAPIHASVSGKVVGIGSILLSERREQTVEINTEGSASSRELLPSRMRDKESLIAAVRASGVVGLGGAGFPTGKKLETLLGQSVDILIVNGAECEPYITSDTLTAEAAGEEIAFAVNTICRVMGLEQVFCAAERSNKRMLDALNALKIQGVRQSVVSLFDPYPQGAERVLIYSVLGRAVPEGGLPVDVGVLVLNVSTLAALGRYFLTGMPLTERLITVAGKGIAGAHNIRVPIGTPIYHILAHLGALLPESKLLYGGPMTGVETDKDAPILKNTNAITVLGVKEKHFPQTTACIRCGRCAEVCPMGIRALEISRALLCGQRERLGALGAGLCIECGCCGYVCPSALPLVQNNRKAKRIVRKGEQKRG